MASTNEFAMLESQLAKLVNSRNEHQRTALVKSVLLWSGRVHNWTKGAESVLTRQNEWLDKKENKIRPNYEARVDEWIEALREYERACDLLERAKAVLPGLTLEVAA